MFDKLLKILHLCALRLFYRPSDFQLHLVQRQGNAEIKAIEK